MYFPEGEPWQRWRVSYRGFVDRAREDGFDVAATTLNGAGSHTLRIYEQDRTMNDLAAGSGVVKPTDFDTHHLADKRYDRLRIPGDPWTADYLPWWDPNMRRVYYIYGGYWKARPVSPAGLTPLYNSANQRPLAGSEAADVEVDDYVFLRPTQSEHVTLQFGDLLAVADGRLTQRWPVFHQTA